MLFIADEFRRLLIPFLLFTGGLLAALLAILLFGRLLEEARTRQKDRLTLRFIPLVDALLLPHPDASIIDQLGKHLRRHPDVLSQLLLAPARFATGIVIDQLRDAAARTGIIQRWQRQLSNRRWWVRADSARALGLLREASSVDGLLTVLNDENEQVRAAGVEALGLIGDPRTIPVLVGTLPNQARYQRVRVIEALHRFGTAAVPSLLAYDEQQPRERAIVAELLGMIGDLSALDHLVRWTEDERAPVRAAAIQALGAIGLDNRTYYYALKALSSDTDADVRAMAAFALGRSGRREAARYLAKHLTDDWVVAAHCARGLRRFGDVGADVLREYADEDGTAGDLARQVLFEMGVDAGQRAVAV